MHAFGISDVVALLDRHLRIGAGVGANRRADHSAGTCTNGGTVSAAYCSAQARAQRSPDDTFGNSLVICGFGLASRALVCIILANRFVLLKRFQRFAGSR
jgi:hypothetical protein